MHNQLFQPEIIKSTEPWTMQQKIEEKVVATSWGPGKGCPDTKEEVESGERDMAPAAS